MPERDDDDMLRLIHAAERAFDAADARPAASEAPARRIFEAMNAGGGGGGGRPADSAGNGPRLSVMAHLDGAIAAARDHGGPVADVAHALVTVAPQLVWERRRGIDNESEAFKQGHANAILVRLEQPGHAVVLGVSLMAPHVRYPDHRHPPEEVYIVLSPGEWRQNQNAWHEPGPGSVVHNPPEIVHAMRSGSAPLLALWLHLDQH